MVNGSMLRRSTIIGVPVDAIVELFLRVTSFGNVNVKTRGTRHVSQRAVDDAHVSPSARRRREHGGSSRGRCHRRGSSRLHLRHVGCGLRQWPYAFFLHLQYMTISFKRTVTLTWLHHGCPHDSTVAQPGIPKWERQGHKQRQCRTGTLGMCGAWCPSVSRVDSAFFYFANEEPVHTYFGIVLLPTRSCFNIRTYFATLLCRIAYQRLHVHAE